MEIAASKRHQKSFEKKPYRFLSQKDVNATNAISNTITNATNATQDTKTITKIFVYIFELMWQKVLKSKQLMNIFIPYTKD